MKKLRDVAANKKKRTKQTVGCTVIDPEEWEAIQEGERALQYKKEAKANELARKREVIVEKKAAKKAKRLRRLQGRRTIKRARKPTIQQPLMRPRKLLYCSFRTLTMETLMG
jgi:DUF438 domain-containing protein